MKKAMISIVVVLILVSSLSALADDFTIHSGVSFGLTEKEVSDLEESNGFTVETKYIGEWLYGLSKGLVPPVDSAIENRFGKTESKCISGSIAGFENSSIMYFFSDDKLYSSIYHFGDTTDSTRYPTLLKTLSDKYGTPVGESHSYLDFPKPGNTAITVYAAFDGLGMFDCSVNDMAQWVIPTDDGYINIILLDFVASRHEEVYLSYSYMSAEEYDTFINNKIDEQAEKSSQLENDL